MLQRNRVNIEDFSPYFFSFCFSFIRKQLSCYQKYRAFSWSTALKGLTFLKACWLLQVCSLAPAHTEHSSAQLRVPRRDNKYSVQNSLLMSPPRVPFNEAAVWLKGLGLWPVGPAHGQAHILGTRSWLVMSACCFPLLWEEHYILSNNLDRERFGDDIQPQKNLAAGLFGSLVTFAETNSCPLLWLSYRGYHVPDLSFRLKGNACFNLPTGKPVSHRWN